MQLFSQSDPGIPRRFQQEIHLDDYTPVEITRIALMQAKDKGYTCSPDFAGGCISCLIFNHIFQLCMHILFCIM
jgi:hypothetical protein